MLMRDRVLWAATVALLVSTVAVPASAGYRRIGDADDMKGPIDVRWAAHGHAPGGVLRHGVGTYGTWRGRALREYGLRIDFDIDKDRKVERQLRVDYLKGRLRAAIYGGRFFDRRASGRVRVRRPNRRSLWVSFAADTLEEGLRRYRWRVLVYARGVCPGSCPADAAPPRGWIRHPL